MAVTVTTGGAISGYCAIGSTRIAASPASTMKIESTAAKIGRSMKKRENTLGYLPVYLAGCVCAAAGSAALDCGCAAAGLDAPGCGGVAGAAAAASVI